MRNFALAVLTLALLCWQPSPAVTQLAAQGPNTQDRDDRQHDQHDNDRQDAQHHDRDRDDQRRDDDRRDNNDSYRDHYRNHNYNGRYPRGSFVRTCRDIRMEGNTMRASCQKNDSRWRDTSLKNAYSCQGQVINDNGRLRCM
jgi:hypothetical protein